MEADVSHDRAPGIEATWRPHRQCSPSRGFLKRRRDPPAADRAFQAGGHVCSPATAPRKLLRLAHRAGGIDRLMHLTRTVGDRSRNAVVGIDALHRV